MKRPGFACFLLLLLSSAMLDDVWAATPTVSSAEAPAADNNEYLSAGLASRSKSSETRDLPALPGAGVAGPRRAALAHAALPLTGPGTHSGPALLYVLMSLQR